MIVNYANRRYPAVEVTVRRAWRSGLRNGENVMLPQPEADRVIRMGYATRAATPDAGTAEIEAPVRKKAMRKKATAKK